ncbi:MAG: branched-chain amino acid ABC transporter substrate-binding protein, partial [Burkholderiales bacterium]|nr:branched-chain amino acid ABC transporter substrate-binding protein [Burkholderiales bacterium]
MTYPTRSLIAGIALSAAMASPIVLAETIKVAFIDPLSGPFAPVGQNLLR